MLRKNPNPTWHERAQMKGGYRSVIYDDPSMKSTTLSLFDYHKVVKKMACRQAVHRILPTLKNMPQELSPSKNN